MAIRIGNAPCSWGVEFGDDPRNPSWQSVLDEACEAGYKGMELGPLGFLPEDPAELEDAIKSLGSSISVSTGQFGAYINGNTLARNFDATVALVEEMLLEPRWDNTEFDLL